MKRVSIFVTYFVSSDSAKSDSGASAYGCNSVDKFNSRLHFELFFRVFLAPFFLWDLVRYLVTSSLRKPFFKVEDSCYNSCPWRALFAPHPDHFRRFRHHLRLAEVIALDLPYDQMCSAALWTGAKVHSSLALHLGTFQILANRIESAVTTNSDGGWLESGKYSARLSDCSKIIFWPSQQ